jgi:hypothetical protein
MTARSIATALMLGIVIGLSVINLARATKDSETSASPRLEAMSNPPWSGRAILPQ